MKIEKIARRIGKELARQDMEKQAFSFGDVSSRAGELARKAYDPAAELAKKLYSHGGELAGQAGRQMSLHPSLTGAGIGTALGAGGGLMAAPEDASATEKAMYALGGAGAGAGAGAGIGSQMDPASAIKQFLRNRRDYGGGLSPSDLQQQIEEKLHGSSLAAAFRRSQEGITTPGTTGSLAEQLMRARG